MGMAGAEKSMVWGLTESLGWRSLVGYSPWGCKKSDTTEQLHFHFQWLSGLVMVSDDADIGTKENVCA